MSYTSAATEVSSAPVNCICQVALAAGFHQVAGAVVAAAAGTVEITTAARAAMVTKATNTVRGVCRMPRYRPAVQWPDLTVRWNAPPGQGTDTAVTWSVCVRDAGGAVLHAH